MKYRMVAIDLDGTLLNDEKVIPNENKKIINQLIDNEVEIAIATGRGYWSAKNFTKNLGRDLTIIGNNGTIVRTMNDDNVLIKKYLDKNDFFTLLAEGRKRGLYPVLHVDHYEEGYDLIFELDKDDIKYSSYLSRISDRYVQIDDLFNYTEPKVLSIVYIGEIEMLKEFQATLSTLYSEKYNTHILDKLIKVGPILEIMNPLGSKWLTLSEYAKEKGIKNDEIVTIGDDNNDIEMLHNAGLGVGMKNCSEKVKQVADVITKKTNNEAGVAHALKEIFKI